MKEYVCNNAKKEKPITEKGGGVYCRLTQKYCPFVSYVFPFGEEIIGSMDKCPAHNIEGELAKKLRLSALEQAKSEIELKIGEEKNRKI